MSRLFARRRLLAVGLSIALAIPLAATTATADGGFVVLRQGDAGPRVLLAQRVLDVNPRTGTFNDETKHAVRRFQDHRGFDVTGIINERTYTALQTRWEAIQDARTRINNKYHRVMKITRNQKGDPYRYGAAGPGAFDCSGLILYVYKQAVGRNLQHLATAQYRAADRITRKQARPGDLVFMHNSGDIYHAAVYAGRGDIIHAGRSGTNVRREHIWTRSVYFARLLPKMP